MGFIISCFKLFIYTDFAELVTNRDKNIVSLYSQRTATGNTERSIGLVLRTDCPAPSLDSEMIIKTEIAWGRACQILKLGKANHSFNLQVP